MRRRKSRFFARAAHNRSLSRTQTRERTEREQVVDDLREAIALQRRGHGLRESGGHGEKARVQTAGASRARAATRPIARTAPLSSKTHHFGLRHAQLGRQLGHKAHQHLRVLPHGACARAGGGGRAMPAQNKKNVARLSLSLSATRALVRKWETQ